MTTDYDAPGPEAEPPVVTPPPAPPKRKKIGSMGVLAALLVVAALAAVYFLVLGPMMSGSSDTAEAPASTPSSPGPPQANNPVPPPNMPPVPEKGASQPPTVQTQPAATPTANAMSLKPLTGEIVISGQVTGISSDMTKMIVKVSRVHVAGRQETNIQPRSKDVLLRKSTTITLRGVPAAASSIKAGVPIQAVGKNKGIGSVLYARKVAQ